MFFPSFDELRPTDIISQKITDAHYSAYLCLKEINNHKYKNENGDVTDIPLQIATSESLTAGLLFSTLVNIPYGGKYKYGAFSVYDTDAKRVFNGVEIDDVYTHKCASQMAVGTLLNSNATLGISVTGNAMPFQTDDDNMRQLGEVFIGVACYIIKDGRIQILTKSIVHNMCIDDNVSSQIRICELFYDTVENEKRLKEILTKKQAILEDIQPELDKIKKMYDGFNEFEITSNVSNYIRYSTVEKAYNIATEFIKENISDIIIPTFIKLSKNNNLQKLRALNFKDDEHFANKSNNLVIDEPLRRNINIIIANDNAINVDRTDTDTYRNKLLFKKKYLKYKQKYLKYKQN